jgi:hypothetical protein
MRRLTLAVASLALLAGLPALSGHGAEQNKLNDLMRRKLDNAQKVLAGVALNDFKAIRRHAEELINISKEAEFKVLKTPRYELLAEDFRRNAGELVRAARDRNADAASLAYVDMSLTCFKCHKHIREVRMVRAD